MGIVEFEQTPNPDALCVRPGRRLTNGPPLEFARADESTHPLVAELLASECAADEEGPLHNRLSERELQVFTRIARGVSPAVMANELGLSVKTVSTYRARILEKMGMRSNAEIAAYAVRNQLVE